MYLSNRDIQWAIDQGILIVRPPPSSGYDKTAIDLHLDSIDKGARIWDVDAFQEFHTYSGAKGKELHLGSFDYGACADKFLIKIADDETQKVFRRGSEVIIKPFGFVVWTTKEWVGTPDDNPQFICFVNAKSKKARTGLVVHLSAPTIHAGWEGNIALEIVNFGPFDFVLQENDSIAQLTVARITSTPNLSLIEEASTTNKQTDPSGSPKKKTKQK